MDTHEYLEKYIIPFSAEVQARYALHSIDVLRNPPELTDAGLRCGLAKERLRWLATLKDMEDRKGSGEVAASSPKCAGAIAGFYDLTFRFGGIYDAFHSAQDAVQQMELHIIELEAHVKRLQATLTEEQLRELYMFPGSMEVQDEG